MELFEVISVFSLIATGFLWFLWQEEKFEKSELEKAVHIAERKTSFIDKFKPPHYIPTRHYGALFPREKAAPYEESRAFESLRNANISGEQQLRKHS